MLIDVEVTAAGPQITGREGQWLDAHNWMVAFACCLSRLSEHAIPTTMPTFGDAHVGAVVWCDSGEVLALTDFLANRSNRAWACGHTSYGVWAPLPIKPPQEAIVLATPVTGESWIWDLNVAGHEAIIRAPNGEEVIVDETGAQGPPELDSVYEGFEDNVSPFITVVQSGSIVNVYSPAWVYQWTGVDGIVDILVDGASVKKYIGRPAGVEALGQLLSLARISLPSMLLSEERADFPHGAAGEDFATEDYSLNELGDVVEEMEERVVTTLQSLELFRQTIGNQVERQEALLNALVKRLDELAPPANDNP